MHAVIVTGVSRGLGEALAQALLDSGATVLGIGRTPSTKLASARFRHVACDLAIPRRSRRASRRCCARWPKRVRRRSR